MAVVVRKCVWEKEVVYYKPQEVQHNDENDENDKKHHQEENALQSDNFQQTLNNIKEKICNQRIFNRIEFFCKKA